VGVVFNHWMIVIVGLVTIAFWGGVVLPGIWSKKEARRKAAHDITALLMGHKDDDHLGDNKSLGAGAPMRNGAEDARQIRVFGGAVEVETVVEQVEMHHQRRLKRLPRSPA
jgi:hypothetical protein